MRGRRIGAVIGVVAALSAGLGACSGSSAADVSDLERFDEIELGGLRGAEVTLGSTRSQLLPVVVKEDGAGETSLVVVDVHDGTTTDAGPIPVEGWATNVYPRASDRYVGMLVTVCEEEPHEGDATDECGEWADGGPIQVELAVYDIQAGTWATVPLPEEDVLPVTLADVDGAEAVLDRASGRDDRPDLWYRVDLGAPLVIGTFAEPGAPRPNGLQESEGHLDGWGWKAAGANGWKDDVLWTGQRGGKAASELIANEPEGGGDGEIDRRFAGAGECLVIATRRSGHLDHLHRLCTS